MTGARVAAQNAGLHLRGMLDTIVPDIFIRNLARQLATATGKHSLECEGIVRGATASFQCSRIDVDRAVANMREMSGR